MPADQWNELRLAKANRNYALDYIRNGIAELAHVIGTARTRELASRAARLIGLQYFAETAQMIGVRDGEVEDAADYLVTMMQGMGDDVERSGSDDGVVLEQRSLRVIRGLTESDAALVFDCWAQLWQGTASSQRQLKRLEVRRQGGAVRWLLSRRS